MNPTAVSNKALYFEIRSGADVVSDCKGSLHLCCSLIFVH